MPIIFNKREMKPYYEVQLWIEDGQYWQALYLDSNRDTTKTHDEIEASRCFEIAKETHDGPIRLVKWMPSLKSQRGGIEINTMSEDEIRNQIAKYEAKYDMATVEMLQANDLPDEFDIIDWKVLARFVDLTEEWKKGANYEREG